MVDFDSLSNIKKNELARSTYKEIINFYEDPKNIEKFNAWKKRKQQIKLRSD